VSRYPVDQTLTLAALPGTLTTSPAMIKPLTLARTRANHARHSGHQRPDRLPLATLPGTFTTSTRP